MAFPLTPALSLREREKRSQRIEHPSALENLATRTPSLPLPEGECRGEGEGNVMNPTLSDFFTRLMIRSLPTGQFLQPLLDDFSFRRVGGGELEAGFVMLLRVGGLLALPRNLTKAEVAVVHAGFKFDVPAELLRRVVEAI